MKFKKIMLVTIVLLAILTIGAVSASQDVNGTDELAASDEAVDVQLPQEDFDEVLSENVAGSDDKLADDGDDGEEELEFNLYFNDEKIITDNNSDDYDDDHNWAAKLYSPQPFEGNIVMGNENVTLFNIHTTDDADDWVFKYGEYRYIVTSDKVSLQGVNEGDVIYLAFYIGDDEEPSALCIAEVDELGEDYILLQDWIDPTKFRIDGYHDDMGVMELGDAVSVYCPDGYVGSVTVTVRNHEGDVATFEKNISDKDEEGLLHWSLYDLNITEVDNYIFYVNACDGEFEREIYTEVYNPLFFEHDLYIEEYINRHAMITVEVPILYSNESRIIVEIDDGVIFNKTLKEFDYVSPYEDTDNSYYCTNEIVGYGENEYQRDRRLYIFTADILENVSAKSYNVNVYAIINGTLLNKSGKIRLHERNIESNDVVTIEIFDIHDFLIDCDDQNVAEITAPEGADGWVLVTCDGDVVFEDELNSLDHDENPDEDNNLIYSIRPCDLDIHEYGEYEIEITYIEDEDIIVEISAVLSFDNNFDGDDPFRFNKNEISTVGDEEYNENTFIVKLVLDEPTPGELRIFKDETLLLDLEIPDNNDDWGIVGWDGSSYYKIFLKDLTLDDVNDGDGLTIEFNYNEDESYSKDFDIEIGDDYFKFLVYEDEDGPLEEIEFNMFYEEDGESVFENGDNVAVAYLLIPESQNDDADVTITVTKNGQPFATIRSTEIEPEYLESREAYQYPINLDLTQVNDKDLLEFNIDCFDEGENVWPYAIEVDGDEVIFHGYYGEISCYIFYGNVTTEDLNSPDTMGPHPNGRFIEFSVPDSYNVAEGSIVVSDGNTVILNKSFDDFDEVEYNYEVLGNQYVITLNEFNLSSLPENETITFTINYGSDSLTFKRIRIADYVCKIITPDDIAVLFDIEIADDVISSADDTVVSIVATDEANRQSIYMDVGGGWFKVFVNDIKVEGLGEKVLNNWIYQSGILDVDEESADDDSYWQLESLNIDPNDFFNADREEKASMLYSAAKDEFGSDIGLFYISSYNLGYPELYLSLEDLGITESGTYNIKITHLPEEPEEGDGGELNDYIVIREDALILEKNVTVTMTDRIDTTISASKLTTVYGSGDELVATLKDADGNPIGGADLVISIGDIDINVVTGNDGKAMLDVSTFDPKVYYATIYYSGDNIYSPSVKENVKVYVQKIGTTLTAADVIGAYHNGTRLVVTLKDANGNALSNEKVTVTIDGNKWDITTNSKGVARFSTDRLDVGNYTANIAYKASTYYYASSTTANILITKEKVDTALSASKLTTVYGSGDELVVTLKDADGNPISDASVVIALGDINTTVVTGSDGKASLDVTTFDPKVYYATIYYAGDDNYNPSVKENVKVYVQKVSTTLTASDVVAEYHSGTRLVVTLKDANGNALSNEKVTVTIDGNKWDLTTNSKGVARFSTDRLDVGNYTANIAYKASTYYYASSTTANILITKEKVDTVLSASKLTTVYGSGDELVVTLKDADGNPISGADLVVSLGDMNFTVVTGADGKASLDVSTLDPKVYYATIYYAGDDNYNPSVKESVKVYVQKIGTTLTASDVVADYHSGTRLVATLKDANGNALSNEKVTVTIDGNKWDLTTNSKGVVRFSTDRLDVGSYTANIAYKASTYYYASSTTVNISIL